MKKILIILGTLAVTLLLTDVVLAQDPIIDWWVIGSGGGSDTAGIISLGGTIGQGVTGSDTTGTTQLDSGFWGGAGIAPAACYTLTAVADPAVGGSVTPDLAPNCDDTQYTEGTVVMLMANPNTGYAFDQWSGDASGMDNPLSVTMDASKSITANFSSAATCYTLTIAVNPVGGGSVSADPAPNCNVTQYTEGTVVTLTANANTGYLFANWSGDAGGTTSPITVTMDITKDVTANFTTCYLLTTAADPLAGGSVSADPVANCGGTYYTPGTVVTLTASASAGYTFSNWSGDASGTVSITTVTMNADRSVTAHFAACYALTTGANPPGGGSVDADPVPNCGAQYIENTVVTLTAIANAGYAFSDWSGDAGGSDNPVAVTVDGDKNVVANFTTCYTLTAVADPAAGGNVSADPPPNCGTQYTAGTVVTLTVNVNAGYAFVDWSGDASGTDTTITVTVDATKHITANLATCYTLIAAANPTTGGNVSADPAPNCGAQYIENTVVTLTATANAGYAFANWSGDASGTISVTTVTMDAGKSAMANFVTCYPLVTAVNPPGDGSVSVEPPPNCGAEYAAGTVVTLTATANAGYAFSNWSGDASGADNPLYMTIDAAKSVTANFGPATTCYTLTTAVDPAGSGSVIANPAPNCNVTQYTENTVVTLTATANVGHLFANWSGDAGGTINPLPVTMTATKSIMAHFATCYALTTDVVPPDGGSVSVDPAPNCGSTHYVPGTAVTLTASANSGYEFANWSGDASGTSDLVSVVMNADLNVIANFSVATCYALTTAVSPPGGGSVSADPAPNCGAEYIAGTVVTLTASAETGYAFDHWSGDASGTINRLHVTINAAKSITANFSAATTCYTLTTAVDPVGGGSVIADPPPNCNITQYSTGTVVMLTADANAGYLFTNWSGDGSGSTDSITVTMDMTRSVTAHFATCYALTTAANPPVGGDVSADPAPNCGSTHYAPGTVVTLTAEANVGYAFDNWSGDASGTANSITVTMDAPRSITANFMTCYSLMPMVNPVGSGSVSLNPAPNCNVVQHIAGTVVTVTAHPNTGYIFINWDMDASGTDTTIIVTVDADKSIRANFSEATLVYLPLVIRDF